MPGFNQQQLSYRVRNANSLIMLLGDQEIGFGQTTSASIDFGTDALYGIGSAKPQENQQLRFSPSITLDSFSLTKEGLSVLGYPSTIDAVLANNTFNFFLMDADGNPVVTYVGCTASNFSLNVPANQPVTESVTFLALDVLDITGVSILNSNSALQLANTVASALNIAGV
ncbi:MAG: hypothetical protein ACYCOU_10740 [Sulfobacillus sp.]